MVGAPARLVDPPPANPIREQLIVNCELDDTRDRFAVVCEELRQLLRLRDGAREAVEHEPLRARLRAQILADDVHDDVVAHEAARFHYLLRLLARRRPRGDSRAQHVARREMAHAVLVDELRGLCALAAAGRAHEDCARLGAVAAENAAA